MDGEKYRVKERHGGEKRKEMKMNEGRPKSSVKSKFYLTLSIGLPF